MALTEPGETYELLKNCKSQELSSDDGSEMYLALTCRADVLFNGDIFTLSSILQNKLKVAPVAFCMLRIRTKA